MSRQYNNCKVIYNFLTLKRNKNIADFCNIATVSLLSVLVPTDTIKEIKVNFLLKFWFSKHELWHLVIRIEICFCYLHNFLYSLE